MQRLIPEVRALWERVRPEAESFWAAVRRPVIMFVIGVGLAAPAGAAIMRQEDAGAAVVASMAAPMTGASHASAATTAESKERADALMTLRLAQLYDVPVGLAAQIHDEAKKAGITPRLAFGLVRTESRFKRTAVSPVGAVGLTQVMPATAKFLEPGTTRSDLFDAATNLHLGFSYLQRLIKQYDGNVRLALTAYNRGPGTVDRLLKRGRNPDNGYAAMVLSDPATGKLARRGATPDGKKILTPKGLRPGIAGR